MDFERRSVVTLPPDVMASPRGKCWLFSTVCCPTGFTILPNKKVTAMSLPLGPSATLHLDVLHNICILHVEHGNEPSFKQASAFPLGPNKTQYKRKEREIQFFI